MNELLNPLPVTVLGATGSVGQRFVQLLDGHPWFRVAALTGSERSVGRPYAEACRWILDTPMPTWAREMPVLPSDPQRLETSVIFSALPSEKARLLEPQFARRGALVFSNASAYRREPDVPILMPEVNADHIHLLEVQRKQRGWRGGIITNSNCTSAGLTVVLKALQDAFGVRRGFVVSMQALSGAGYPGVASLDILDNVIPYIAGEEDKVEWEPRKMLGSLEQGSIHLADFVLSAHANRVAVRDAHTLSLSVELGEAVSLEAVAAALKEYLPPEAARGLPSTPRPVIALLDAPDRPQPRRDRWMGDGMTTVVGRLRPDPLFHVKMTVLSHNTVRGAAGGSIYNAELALRLGLMATLS
ncbi:MAG: aspartate-semialdehyde dehydrogenase [Anaerolineae bacterium]|nr:MAG: aspartate-semialdehyde dehydrogenase [Anaerolineae bacterium]